MDKEIFDLELKGTLEQALTWFLAKEGIDSKDWNIDQMVDVVFNDDELIRQFAIYLILELNEFIHQRAIVVENDSSDLH